MSFFGPVRLYRSVLLVLLLASMLAWPQSSDVSAIAARVDRHYNHSDGTYPLAHNPVTSFYVSGPVRFPVDLRLYLRADGQPLTETWFYQWSPPEDRRSA